MKDTTSDFPEQGTFASALEGETAHRVLAIFSLADVGVILIPSLKIEVATDAYDSPPGFLASFLRGLVAR